MVSFIHTSDWQLGMTRHFLTDEAQARYSAARLDAVNAIGALANDKKCDFVLVCGDVFESNHVDRQIIVRTLEALNNYSMPVYLLPGNHDPLDASSVYHFHSFENSQPDHVNVIESSDAIGVVDGVQLIGAPWFSKQPLTDLVGQTYQGLVGEEGCERSVKFFKAVSVFGSSGSASDEKQAQQGFVHCTSATALPGVQGAECISPDLRRTHVNHSVFLCRPGAGEPNY